MISFCGAPYPKKQRKKRKKKRERNERIVVVLNPFLQVAKGNK